MARVTVEDCVDKVPNRFELVMLAAHRAREISTGAEITVVRDNDKNPVVALREIADETQSADDLRERLIESNQNQIEVDEPEEDAMALLMGAEQDKPEEDTMSEEMLLRQLMAAQGFCITTAVNTFKLDHIEIFRLDVASPRQTNFRGHIIGTFANPTLARL